MAQRHIILGLLNNGQRCNCRGHRGCWSNHPRGLGHLKAQGVCSLTKGIYSPLFTLVFIYPDAYCIQPSSELNNVLPVDYSNIDHLVSVLEANQIDTVISAFAVEGDSLEMAQLNLIEATTKSKPTKRFIPSAFAVPYPKD